MNNYHYIAIQKAASWDDNFTMVLACVNEFHMINPAETMDTPAQAISAAYENGISTNIIKQFEA